MRVNNVNNLTYLHEDRTLKPVKIILSRRGRKENEGGNEPNLGAL
jgi:hypothetical protein